MRRITSSRHLHKLLLPILLLTTSAVGQEKSVEQAMAADQSTGSTMGTTSSSVDKESKETAKADASHSQKPREPAAGGESAAELSKKLSNPVSSLISFPVQTSFDFGMGTGSGWRMTTNVQPVIPVALN